MSETEKLAVGALFSAVLLLAPGFLLHEAARFPGSLMGGVLGIAAATQFFALLIYVPVKRVAVLRRRLRPAAALSFHIYAGVIGALLGVLHSGHSYRSPLGIALMATMLGVIGTGFVGRYYLAHVGADLHEQSGRLSVLRSRYAALEAPSSRDRAVRRLVAAIADLEWAIARRDVLKRALSRWVILHVALALAMYALLALHIWSGVYYGLRWLQ